MGREARCTASWGPHRGEVTIHLDSAALTARGAFRTSAPLDAIAGLRVEGDTLRFRAGDDEVALGLGAAAARWATALAKRPPTLAEKFGLGPGTRVAVEGKVDDAALREALAAAPVADGKVDVIVARTDDGAHLERVAEMYGSVLERGTPLWVVYTKGKGAPLGETAVRALMRERGLTDVKVAAVSPALSALKFVRTRAKLAHS